VVALQAIRAAHGFDGSRRLPGPVTVLLDGDRIVATYDGAADIPTDVAVRDYGDATVLPGLINSHTHLCGDGRSGALDRLPDYDDAGMTAVMEQSLRQQLAAGVTTVRDLGDRRGAVLAWRASHDEPTGLPRIVAAGPPITSPRGHCANMGGETAGTDEMVAAVEDRLARGADVIKVMASGGAMTLGTDMSACQFADVELRLLVRTAHERGVAVTAHAHALVAIEQGLSAGVDGIEHCSALTGRGPDLPAALADRLAAAEIWVCPTVGRADIPTPPEVQAVIDRTGLSFESSRERVRTLHAAGVRLLAGADDGINAGKPHGLVPAAVAELAQCMPVADALICATSASAAALSSGSAGAADVRGATIGVLAAGAAADVLVVPGNLHADLTALQRPIAVYLAGSLVPAS